MTARIDVGSVDEVAATVEISVEHRLGVGDRRAPAVVLAESHRAEAVRRNAEPRATECDVGVQCGHDRNGRTGGRASGRTIVAGSCLILSTMRGSDSRLIDSKSWTISPHSSPA